VSIQDAPWHAKITLLAFSQLMLSLGQYFLYKQEAGPYFTLAAMVIQAAQGGLAAFGPRMYSAASKAVAGVLPGKQRAEEGKDS
jgi:hypothetical protein